MIRSTRKPQCKKPSFDVRHDARIEAPGKLLNKSLRDFLPGVSMMAARLWGHTSRRFPDRWSLLGIKLLKHIEKPQFNNVIALATHVVSPAIGQYSADPIVAGIRGEPHYLEHLFCNLYGRMGNISDHIPNRMKGLFFGVSC